MKRIYPHACVFIFMVLFIAPTIENVFRPFPKKGLYGVEYSTDFPALTAKSWLDGSFQSKFEAWYERVYGLRRIFVKTENEINYLLFREISGCGVVLGKKNMMFENCYVFDAIGVSKDTSEHLEEIAINLRKLQDLLESHGVAFLFIITPSKATIYPEFLPEHIAKLASASGLSNYDRLLPSLNKYGINYLDGHTHLTSLKRSSSYPVFCRGGTHWNYYAAYLFTQEIMARLEELLGKKFNRLETERIFFRKKPYGADADLARLANLWDKSPLVEKSPYPEVKRITVPGAIQPNVLLIGGSFVWTILHWVEHHEIIDKKSDFYYYFSQKKISNMQKEIFSRDAVILETNEAALAGTGFGFIEEVLNPSHMAAANR